jgi:deoxycytidylate deaminase
MAINIKSNTGTEFHKAIRERVDKASFDILSRAGEMAVIYARQHGTYQDRTTNLRNSVGYVIMKDGLIISGKFQSGKSSSKAASYAQTVAAETAQTHKKGYVLIVVAGMEYAAYVEAKGYDVLSGAGNVLKAYISQIVKQIKDELNKL